MKTPIVDSSNPKWNEKATFNLKRNKLAELHFTQRRASIDLIAKGGWFSGETALINHKLKLDPLLTSCKYNVDIPVKKPDDKKLNGTLRIKMQLRTPLLKPELKKVETKRIVIGSYPAPKKRDSQPDIKVVSSAASQVVNAPRRGSDKLSFQDLDKRDILDPHNANRLLSYDVLSQEIEYINSLKVANPKNTDLLMELSNNEMIVNTLKTVMEVKLANGTLTPEVYRGTLTEAVGYDTKLAIYLKHENRVR